MIAIWEADELVRVYKIGVTLAHCRYKSRLPDLIIITTQEKDAYLAQFKGPSLKCRKWIKYMRILAQQTHNISNIVLYTKNETQRG